VKELGLRWSFGTGKWDNSFAKLHPPASQNAIAYLSYQLGGGSLERRAVEVEIIIAEFHGIDAPTP
jgi:hypothetical protein